VDGGWRMADGGWQKRPAAENRLRRLYCFPENPALIFYFISYTKIKKS
jgi:hypothetical protein